MDLKRLKDGELLDNLKQFVQSERQLLTKILHHLKEVERRKLFSELGYRSLFEYAVKELKYSEGQAGRRIQAMRLIKEIPSMEEKIASGHLSLSNVSQAQSYFREMKKCLPQHKMPLKDKIEVLKNLEGKSAREGQKVLLKMQPQEVVLPKERKKIVTETHTQVSFIMTSELEVKIEELRSLLGYKGAAMNLAELVEHMVEVILKEAKIKKFGKKRVTNSEKTPTSELENQSLSLSDKLAINNLEKSVPYKTAETKNSDITISEKTPTSELENHCLSLSDELAINNLEKFVPYKTAKTKDSDKKDRIENKDRVDSKDQDKSELDDNDLDDNELDDNELDSKNLDKKYQDRKVQEKRKKLNELVDTAKEEAISAIEAYFEERRNKMLREI